MLRRVAHPSVVKRLSNPGNSQRLYATSREKRALNESQLKGKQAAAKPAKDSTKPPAPPAKAAPSGGGGGGSGAAIVLALAAGGAGYAYYENMIPGYPFPGTEPAPETKQEEEKPAVVEAVEPEPAPKEEEAPVVEQVAEVAEEVVEEPVAPVEVVQAEEEVAPVEEVVSEKVEEAPVAAAEPEVSTSTEPASSTAPTVDAALEELQEQISRETSRALSEAHQELAKLSSMDLSELDNMTMTQLKIRLVQMAKDMEDRTKWEAVRLKEFLAMKEKEVEDKYVIMLKKQRNESEAVMEQRMREQKYELNAEADRAMQEKEKSLQSIVDSSLKIQEQQFNDERGSFEKKTEEAVSAKYEEMFGQSLAEAKQNLAARLEQKVQQVEALTKKLSELEYVLQSTKSYQSGSLQAHRMSAAALSLIDKLESSKPAGAAVAALQSVSEDNAVVQSALEALPTTVASSGIATLHELQTRFEERVHKKCRQASFVPAGQTGLEGQLLGMAFATLRFPPGPEDAAPEDNKDASEYVLARARRHVQLGELEPAVEQMSKLTGQAALTAQDWVKSAKERVAVEKALKVIRLECALANETMSSRPGSE